MDKKQLRSIGHHLKPVVMVAGDGLSEGVMSELNRALNDHELIKIKVAIDNRDTRKAIFDEISAAMKAETIQTIGKVALILRKNSKPNPKTSNLVRHLSDL